MSPRARVAILILAFGIASALLFAPTDAQFLDVAILFGFGCLVGFPVALIADIAERYLGRKDRDERRDT